VTIVYDGEVAHRDSTGAGGVVGPGDVQWMTAASGILHDEYHSEAFTRHGGTLEMVQLWVNLPAKDKLSAPGYQDIRSGDIPEVALPAGAGSVRVIAGNYDGHAGPARTFTPVDVWDVRLNAAHAAAFEFVEGRTLIVVVLRGNVSINGEIVGASQLALFDRDNQRVSIEANSDATLLVLGGEPIDEPVVGRGPFVMNSEREIRQAVVDFNRGEFGRMQA
jgi:redox-sensitive bicupin YhaK (pirin superfamily)